MHGVRSVDQNARVAVCEWHKTKEILIANIDHALWSLAWVAMASSLRRFASCNFANIFQGPLSHDFVKMMGSFLSPFLQMMSNPIFFLFPF